jgi:RND family efflux transporter MFP subunit
MPRRLLVPLVLAVPFVALAGCKKQNAYVPPPPPQVGVAQPLQMKVTPALEATGNAKAFNQVDLVARVEGFLQEIGYQDGAMARRGDMLFVIEPSPYRLKLQQAEASQAAAEASLVASEADFSRQSTLVRSDFASRAAVDQSRQKRDSDKANLSSQQAAVTLAAINLAYTNVAAPFDGLVSAHEVSVGGLVGVGSATRLATITQIDPINVSFTISEQDVLRIKAALTKRGAIPPDFSNIRVEVGRMDEDGHPHVGKLDYVASSLDSATGTLAVRAVLANADRALLPGMFVRIRIPLADQEAAALLVPDQALGANQAGSYLLVVDKDGVVQQRGVRIGPLQGRLRVIESGLAADDRVVISGMQKSIPGQKVAPQPATIEPPTGKP